MKMCLPELQNCDTLINVITVLGTVGLDIQQQKFT